MTEYLTDRLERLRLQMAKTQTDLTVVGPGSHMQWLLGLNPHGDERPVMALITQNDIAVLLPMLNAEAARAQRSDLSYVLWSDEDGPSDALDALLDSLDIRKTGIRVVLDETMRADFAFLILDHLPSPAHRFSADTLGVLRAEKTEDELRLLRQSAHLNDDAFRLAFASLKTGMSEQDVADIIVGHYKLNTAEPVFCTVAFGENTAFPHHHTSAKILQPDMPVLIDAGCRLQGYPSDMTRCAWYGEGNARFEQIAGIVETAVQAAYASARPHAKCQDVDRAARQVISDAGFGPEFTHRTGHGLGIDVHEPPYITATNSEPLKAGHVFTIEPGVYLKGEFGIRLEDTVYLHEDGAEVLSSLPRTVERISTAD